MALRSGFTNTVTLSPSCRAVRVQPSLIRTFGAVISTVQSPSGAPAVLPSTLNEACGLIQRNCFTVPSILMTLLPSNAAVEWCAATGKTVRAPTAATAADNAIFCIVFMGDFLFLQPGAAGLSARQVIVQVG